MKSADNNIIYLIERCKENDRLSQKIIYEKYYGKMMGVALRYFNNSNIAKDIVQESFIKIFKKIDQFKGGKNFEGWIKRIVVNHSLDQLRKNKNIYFVSDEAIKNISEEKEEDLSNYKKLKTSDVIEAVQQLSSGYRTVFNLYIFDGLTHKEIAKSLNISEGTSKSNYSKAKSKLKEILSKKDNLE